MPITTTMTASAILNRVAVEVGLDSTADPYGSQDAEFIRLQTLLNIAGEELAIMHDWDFLVRDAAINTDVDDSGEYALPADFLYITNQTVWERNNRVPVILLSAQDWQYLEGTQFAKDTIYAKFRLQKGKFTLYPQPTPTGLDIHYEYTSKNWVLDGSIPDTFKEEVTTGTDSPLYDRTLITRYVRLKWLEVKGFDTAKAQDDFNQIFGMLTGRDKGAPILSVGGGMRGLPLLNAWRNIGDSNFGS
jgi:hypothetical protein